MGTIVKAFHLQNFDVQWINAISRIGYLTIIYEPGKSGDFPSMWLLADELGQFLKNEEGCNASAVAFHYYECDHRPKQLFVIPRYPDEYPDHNDVYNIAESDSQPETSTVEIICPLIEKLMNKFKIQ